MWRTGPTSKSAPAPWDGEPRPTGSWKYCQGKIKKGAGGDGSGGEGVFV